jgi:diguanylate cyclase (GGDEF)-like protein
MAATKSRRGSVKRQLLRVLADDLPTLELAAAIAAPRPLTSDEKKAVRRLRRRRRAAFCSDLLWVVAHTHFPHEVAERLWPAVVEHQRTLARVHGRDMGVVVAALDYLTNVAGVLGELTLIPARQLSTVAELALTDGLTRLLDQTAFRSRLADEVLRYERHGVSFALVMMDLDDFKVINDTYGHQVGDDVLRGVAQIIRENTRGADLAARYGGEEFAVLTPHATVAEAHRLAERIRMRVDCKHAALRGVTVSMGVAGCPQHASSMDALIRAADRALYASKRRGKNRVTTARRQTARTSNRS